MACGVHCQAEHTALAAIKLHDLDDIGALCPGFVHHPRSARMIFYAVLD